MNKFDANFLKDLYIPDRGSHKGQNGKVLVIGGSHFFHSSAFWALEIASKIVDMVYFSSYPMNNDIVKDLKTKFYNGIIVEREDVEDYIMEADVTLIGPGLPRIEGQKKDDDDTKELTERLLKNFPEEKWVIDGGSLQVISPEILPKGSIITPNKKEFKMLFGIDSNYENVEEITEKYGITILSKGDVDIVANEEHIIAIEGGNAGMTKGRTGDVLAGLTAALFTKNDAFLSAISASYINKTAGEELEKTKGIYFNSSDLVEKIPEIMKKNIVS